MEKPLEIQKRKNYKGSVEVITAWCLMRDQTRINKINFEEVEKLEKEICQRVRVMEELSERNQLLIGVMDLATRVMTVEN